ncbi:DUF7619 domain-containing protein [Microbacterium terricola]|nr:hypothetical protein [Microbacterium terricola]
MRAFVAFAVTWAVVVAGVAPAAMASTPEPISSAESTPAPTPSPDPTRDASTPPKPAASASSAAPTPAPSRTPAARDRSRTTSPSTTDEVAECVPTTLATWNAALPAQGSLSDDGPGHCYDLAITQTDDYLVRLGAPETVAMTLNIADGGTAVGTIYSSSPEPLTRTLAAGHTYRLTLTGDSGDYAIGVFRLSSTAGCTTALPTAWDAAATTITFAQPATVACRSIPAAANNVVRVTATTEASATTARVVNGNGNALCNTRATLSSSPAPVDCTLSGGSPWRVLVYNDRYSSPDDPLTADLWAATYNSTAGCVAGALGAWGDQLPISAERNTAHGAECFLVTTAQAGAYALRIVDQSDRWTASVQLYDATGVPAATVSADFSGVSTATDLKPNHVYRLIVTGDPDGWDGAYTAGMLRIAATAGCTTLPSTAWNAAAATTDFTTGDELNCTMFTASSSAAVRVTHDASADHVIETVLNSSGATVCTLNAWWTTSVAQDCTLSGASPWRLITSLGPQATERASVTADIWVSDYASTTGCTAGSLAAWGADLPVVGSRSTTRPADCHLLTTAQAGPYLLRAANDANEQWTAEAGLYEANGNLAVQTVSSSWGSFATANLKANTTYRLIVRGDTDGWPGDYAVGLYRLAATSGCASSVDDTVSLVSPRAAHQRTSEEAVDCHASSLARNSHVRVDVLRATNDPLAWQIVDATGAYQCSGSAPTHGADCNLTGPTPYRVLVTGQGTDPYEIGLRRVTDGVGCPLISNVASGIPPQSGTLTRALDVRCYRFPGGAGDEIGLQAVNRDLENVDYRVDLYDPEGAALGQAPWDGAQGFELQMSGEYLAVVSLGSQTPGAFRFSTTCFNPACGTDALTVVSTSPSRVGASAEVTVNVRGKALGADTTIELTSGSQTIVGTVMSVSDDGRELGVHFDLTGRAGSWGLRATAPDGQTSSVANAVSIGAVQLPKITTSVNALGRFVAGRPQTVSITVENSGNVDALGVPIFIEGLPAGSTIKPLFDIYGAVAPDAPVTVRDFVAENMVYSEEDGVAMPLMVSRLPGGGKAQFAFEVTIGQAVDYAFAVRAGECFFFETATVSTTNRSLKGVDAFGISFGGWGAGGCTDALVDLATGFIPGSDCQGLAIDTGLAISRNIVQGAPPFSAASTSDMFWSAVGTAACVGSFTPAAPILKGIMGVKNLFNAGKQCWPKDSDNPVQSVASLDPNEIAGPAGGGEQRAIRGEGTFRYAIFFENSKDATAPAQEVRITNQLDPAVFDLSTVRFAGIHFGSRTYTPPADSPALDDTMDLERADGLQLDVTASATASGLLTWHLASSDPFTGVLPQDPFVGFLPPNTNGTEGQGVVYYDVALKSAVGNGATVTNVADIVFDLNDAIRTNTWSNLIDRDTPTASLTAPATSSTPAFPVTWTVADATSGVDHADIYVSTDGGAYELWKTATASGSDTFAGSIGHVYGFSVTARDFAGNTSLLPPTPHATTSVQTLSGPTPTVAGSASVGSTLTATAGVWTTGATLAYQWLRDGAPIAGATKATYKVAKADRGTRLVVRVTGSKGGETLVKTSAATTRIPTVGAVTVSGTVRYGATLTAKAGTWTAGTTFTYSWLRNGSAIKGATKATYKLGSADRGKQISVKVTGKKSGYTTVSATSAKTAKVATVGTVKIAGTAVVGRTLGVSKGTWTSGTTFAYSWLRNGVAIKGATKATYKLVTADRGKQITVKVTGRKSGYATVTVTSSKTAKVR